MLKELDIRHRSIGTGKRVFSISVTLLHNAFRVAYIRYHITIQRPLGPLRNLR
uniref:Uncharacterized protein n=1 Tax=Anguilla anguilla TaxID=7936 RepID=A0A0E9RHG4_ANGAN